MYKVQVVNIETEEVIVMVQTNNMHVALRLEECMQEDILHIEWFCTRIVKA